MRRLMFLLAAVAAASAWTAATAAASTTKTFTATGAEQTFTVPVGVTSLQITAIGGKGGSPTSAHGGEGASVTGTLSVTQNEVLYIEVGGNGSAYTGGFNGGATGGGGGGGASDVRTIAAGGSGSLGSRLIVAAGGGGAGSFDAAGGNAGAAGTKDAQVCPSGGGGGGGAGTATAGGAGGAGQGSGAPGSPGSSGSGGAGGLDAAGQIPGGGGGGRYGGGGAGGCGDNGGGGGGGGSNLVPSGGSASLSTSSPQITITYTQPTNLITISQPSNVTAPATSANGAAVTYPPPTVTDTVQSPPPAPVCDPASGSEFPIGTTTVTCTATDSKAANSPATSTFTVTVTTVGSPAGVDNSDGLDAVACPTAALCIGVGEDGDGNGAVVAVPGGTPGAGQSVTGTTDLDAIACETATHCFAAGEGGSDSAGVVVPITVSGSTIKAGSVLTVGDASEIEAVACPLSTSCLATTADTGTEEGAVVPIVGGAVGDLKDVAGTAGLYGIACPDAASCQAGAFTGSTGALVPITVNATGYTLGSASTISDFVPTALACATATDCEGSGVDLGSEQAAVVQITNGTAGAPADVPGTTFAFGGIACPGAGTCEAVMQTSDGNSEIVPVPVGGSPQDPLPVSGVLLSGVACPTYAGCEVVGRNGSQGVIVPLSTELPAPPATSTALSCAPSSLAVKASATCTATVTDSGSGTANTPTGLVTFTRSGSGAFSDSGICTLSASGTAGKASCQVTYTPSAVGATTLRASYAGDPAHASSTVTTKLTILRSTATTLSCSPSSVVVNAATTCMATVIDSATGTPVAPTGKVTFTRSGSGAFSHSGTCTLAPGVTGGTAYCEVTYTPSAVGATTVRASFGGDSAHTASTVTTKLTIVRPTTTTLTCTPASLAVKAASTCTATVKDSGTGTASTPTGTITLSHSGSGSFSAETCRLAPAVATGTSACAVTYTPSAVGATTLRATFGGDSAHASSTGTTKLTILRSTTTTLSCSPGSVAVNAATTCTATVKDSASGTPVTPKGSVTFTHDGSGTFSPSPICTLVAGAAGTASCQITYRPSAVVATTLRASYSGDSAHTASSGTTKLTVVAS